MGSEAENTERWVFGLSLDNEIKWCLTKLIFTKEIYTDGDWDERSDHRDRIQGVFEFKIQNRYDKNFEKILRKQILDVKAQHDEMNMVSAIGVSIVGMADRKKLQLVNIARQDWGKPSMKPAIDFRRLFEGVFPNIDLAESPWKINIQNESTEKCQAEWRFIEKRLYKTNRRREMILSLLYVMFSRGVNCGFVASRVTIGTELHHELGHLWPRLHRLDYNFNPDYAGCRVHKFCFEGLASSTRIHKDWGNGRDDSYTRLSDFPSDHPSRDIIAFYMAQMCMNGMVAFSPAQIVIGGDIIFDELLDDIREYFYYFASGGGEEFYPDYDAIHTTNFIRMAEIPSKEAGLAAARELARLVGTPSSNRDRKLSPKSASKR